MILLASTTQLCSKPKKFFSLGSCFCSPCFNTMETGTTRLSSLPVYHYSTPDAFKQIVFKAFMITINGESKNIKISKVKYCSYIAGQCNVL